MELILQGVSKAYGEKTVLRDFSHRFPGGAFSCILGPSGCGKTTLLRLICGLIPPDSGRILGAEGQKNSAVFQENRLFENLTAEKNLMLTARRGFSRTDARALLQELGIEDEASMPVHSLSGGMQRRTALARALAADYDLLLLDEPFSGLDGETRRRALQTLRRHATGRTVICVTHDPADAEFLGAHSLRF